MHFTLCVFYFVRQASFLNIIFILQLYFGMLVKYSKTISSEPFMKKYDI